jgi:hypothetical protein
MDYQKLLPHKEEIIKEYLKGASLKALGLKYSVKYTRIRSLLVDNNIKITTSTRNRSLRENYFESIDSPNKAYLLGFITADGSVNYRARGAKGVKYGFISIELASKDEELLDFFLNEIQGNYKKYYRPEKDTYSISIHSTKMVDDLSKYGVIPNKTYLAEEIHSFADIEIQKHYLRGLLDGDGTIYKMRKPSLRYAVEFVGYSESFVTSFGRSMHKIINVPYNRSIYNRETSYAVVWKGMNETGKIFDTLYNNEFFALKRKKNLALAALKI